MINALTSLRRTTLQILGIETSCDETAAAVVNERLQVLSSVVASQISLHRVTQGVVPEIAARAHTEKILPVVHEALRRAGLAIRARSSTGARARGVASARNAKGANGIVPKIDAIAVTYGPGLITSLLVGVETAKALAYGWNVPLVGINHIEGHMLSNLLVPSAAQTRRAGFGTAPTKARQRLQFDKKRLPIVILTVSGGHTELYVLRDLGDYKLLGRTRDDAAGEAFDKVAKLLGLPYPGGPAISAAGERGNPGRFSFPRPMMSTTGPARFDFSFSGLKTAVAQEVEELSGLSPKLLADIAASFEQAVVDTLLAKASLAATETKAKELWIVGGVAANQRLRDQARSIARSKKMSLRLPSFEFCTDNAVMIAAVGALKLSKHTAVKRVTSRTLQTLEADPNLDLVRAKR